MKTFWKWYERNETLNIGIAAFLFTLQLVHLYWLTTHIVALEILGRSYFEVGGIWELIITLVDYTEIPALIATSLVYINNLRKRYSLKAVLFLIFLNSQWLHIFWITDEVVLEHFTGKAAIYLPHWLALAAIAIDYLELPVIFDTIKEFIYSLKKSGVKAAFVELKED